MQAFDLMGIIRILMADDHQTVRQLVRTRLSREEDLHIVGEATNSDETIRLALHERPHVILIDPIMQDGWGLATVRELKDSLPETSVIVLTAIVDTAMKMKLRELGVKQILPKGISSQELIAAIHSVMPGSAPGYTVSGQASQPLG